LIRRFDGFASEVGFLGMGEGSMPYYRIYLMDDKGHSSEPPRTTLCDNDDEAQDVARQLLDGHALEVWCGDRKVATLKPNEPT
jgi:hypothetical protein